MPARWDTGWPSSAVTGHDVWLVDHRQANLDTARNRIRQVIGFLTDQGLLDRDAEAVLDRIEFTLQTRRGVDSADIVLESISEDLSKKQDLFAELTTVAPADAILAPNTSSLPIRAIATGASEAADRIADCHCWYPPYLLRPVEVIAGEETTWRGPSPTTATGPGTSPGGVG